MKIVHIVAGAGGTYCGACQRDAALVRGLRARGHDVLMVPLYTPPRVEGGAPAMEEIFYGGLNCWLQDRFAFFRRTPRPVDRLFDAPGLLRAVGRFAVSTRAEDLGGMTVSVLRGGDGRQRKELDRLVGFLEETGRPDVVSMTNSLLVGLAPAIRRRLGCRLACSFQGEESFVARFPAVHREEALALMRAGAREVDLFLSPGEAYASAMAELLRIPRGRVRIVRAGIDLAPFGEPRRRPDRPFRVGYLSRRSPAKGLDTLVEAFCILARGGRGDERLAVAGERIPAFENFWRRQVGRLEAAGLADRLEDAGEPDLAGKAAFLGRCSVFCVPSRIEEQRAAACLEAMAAGAPLVVPGRGVLREIVETTGGGTLVPRDDPERLAAVLASLRDDPERARRLGEAARRGVQLNFSADIMVEQTVRAYAELVRPDEGRPAAGPARSNTRELR